MPATITPAKPARAEKAHSRKTPAPPSSSKPDHEVIASAAASISEAMDQLLIFAAALKSSECELARSIGVRLGLGCLHNDLDIAHEVLIERAAAEGR
jgi:hypothetical protein